MVLSDGWALDGGDVVVVSDDCWIKTLADPVLLARLKDLGSTTEVPDPVPTWRDIQQATRTAANGSGLQDEITAINTALGDHVADTTNVHGIADTTLLETKVGAQSKADLARSLAQGYTDAHAARTTDVHGISDTTHLATREYVDAALVVDDYRQVFNVASAATTWVLTHNRNTFSLHVETFDNTDVAVEGNVRYPTASRVEIDFYYPMSGYARVWD